MFEETNQTMEGNELENLPENLFEDESVDTDFTPESDEETSGRETDNAQGTDDGEKGGENHAEGKTDNGGATLRVKYNGEEKELSLEEARTLAQKGMNYDHVVEERDKNREAFNFLRERAKSEGVTVEQFIEKERGKAANQRLEEKMSEIRARDDDASEETIKSLAQFELDAEKARAEQKSAEEIKQKNDAEIEGWNRLFREHPELISSDGGAKVTQEVLDLVKTGYSPVEAYYVVRNRELETQNKVYSDASTAKKKSVGSLAGVQNADEDDFMAGFNFE